MMRYFARQSENPESDKYQTPQSLHRFDVGENHIVTERYDPEEGWVDNPQLISFLGIGGDQDYKEVDEATAQNILGQIVGDESKAAELLAESGQTQIEADELAQGPEPLERFGRIHIDEEEGAWLREKGGEGVGTYPGGAKEPSDGILALPEGLVSAQRRKGFVRDGIAPAPEQTPEEFEAEVQKGMVLVQKMWDKFIGSVLKRRIADVRAFRRRRK